MVDLKRAALALFSFAASAAAQDADDEEIPLKVMFVNQFPDKSIDLFWENHAFDVNHPDRRRHEATIAPRGGWHKSETFFGHGK